MDDTIPPVLREKVLGATLQIRHRHIYVCSASQPEENLTRNFPGDPDRFKLNYIPTAITIEYKFTTAPQGGPSLATFTKPAETAWLTDNGNWRAINGSNGEFSFFARAAPAGAGVRNGNMGSAIGALGGTDDTPTATYNPNAPAIRSGIAPALRRVSYRHNGGADFVFVDGHVKWLKGETVFNNVAAAARRSLADRSTMFDVEQP